MRKRNFSIISCMIIILFMPLVCFAGASLSQNDYIEGYNQRIAFYGFANQATIVSPLNDTHTFYLPEEKRIILRSYDMESFSFAICIEENTERAVAIQVLIDDDFLYAANAEDKKLILSICKAMMDAFCEVSTDKQESITKKLFTSNGDLNDDVRFFDTDFVFESGYEGNSPVRSATSFSITTVSQDDFNSNFYWTPHNSLEYFTQAGDMAIQSNDFDTAILLYEQNPELSNLERAYRAKADYLLAQGDIEGANKVLKDAGLDEPLYQEKANDLEYLLHREIKYDKNGELRSIMEHTYNVDGRKLSSTYTYYYSKSSADQLKEYGASSDPISVALTYEYNDLGQVIVERVNGGTTGGYYLSTYNANGNKILRQEYDDTGAILSYTIYNYDRFGNIIKESLYSGSSKVRRVTINEYEYDSAGHKIARTETYYVLLNGSTTPEDVTVSKYTYEQDSNGKTVKSIGYSRDGSIDTMGISEYDSYGNETKFKIYSSLTSNTLRLTGWVDYEYISITDVRNKSFISDDPSERYTSPLSGSFSVIGEWKAVYWIDYITMDENGIDPNKRIPNEYLIPETSDIRLIINDNSLETINNIGRSKISDWRWYDKTTIIRINLSEDDEEESFTVIDSDTIHSGGGDGILVFQRIPMNH